MSTEQEPIPIVSRETSSGELLVEAERKQLELERSCVNVSNDCVLIEDVTSQEDAPGENEDGERFEFADLGPNFLPSIESNRELKELLVQWGM